MLGVRLENIFLRAPSSALSSENRVSSGMLATGMLPATYAVDLCNGILTNGHQAVVFSHVKNSLQYNVVLVITWTGRWRQITAFIYLFYFWCNMCSTILQGRSTLGDRSSLPPGPGPGIVCRPLSPQRLLCHHSVNTWNPICTQSRFHHDDDFC